VVLELQPSQLPLQWPVPLLSWCGVPVHVHVGSHWAVAGLPWTLSLHHLPCDLPGDLLLECLRPTPSAPAVAYCGL
jgi:hypothetical protein